MKCLERTEGRGTSEPTTPQHAFPDQGSLEMNRRSQTLLLDSLMIIEPGQRPDGTACSPV